MSYAKFTLITGREVPKTATSEPIEWGDKRLQNPPLTSFGSFSPPRHLISNGQSQKSHPIPSIFDTLTSALFSAGTSVDGLYRDVLVSRMRQDSCCRSPHLLSMPRPPSLISWCTVFTESRWSSSTCQLTVGQPQFCQFVNQSLTSRT